jgi:hypothetical protein
LPSHLRELLDFPETLSGFLHVPDSVEILSIYGNPGGPLRALIFGAESRLREFTSNPVTSPSCRAFMQVSGRSLKHFREELEFSPRERGFTPEERDQEIMRRVTELSS